MNFKKMTRLVMSITIAISVFGAGSRVYAQGHATNFIGAQIIIRSTTFWEALFNGTVNANRFERWALQIEDPENFIVTVTTTSGNLVPDIYLLDAGENQIALANGVQTSASLTTNQPAGDYYIQVQPHSGEGTYLMQISRVQEVLDPTATIVLNPAEIFIGETSTGTVMLSNVPASGYASAEFTCTYDPTLIQISSLTDAGRFGTDPAVAIFGPANGSFVFAVAGSNGQRATTDGPVFTFTITGLAEGEAQIDCVARVSTGGALSEIEFTPASLTVKEPLGTLTGTVTATKTVTVTLYKPDTSVEAATTADASGNFTMTAPAGTYTVVASAPGFLKAQGSPVLTSGNTTTMQTIALLAGDIDGNDVIDQFDALTIGINYNLAAPAAADLNNDGIINVLDLEMLAANYLESGALVWQ